MEGRTEDYEYNNLK